VNHISQVLALRRGFAGYLTLRYTLVTPFGSFFAADLKQNNDIEVETDTNLRVQDVKINIIFPKRDIFGST